MAGCRRCAGPITRPSATGCPRISPCSGSCRRAPRGSSSGASSTMPPPRRRPPRSPGSSTWGRGTALRVESEGLEDIRYDLALALHGLLTPQDMAPWRPHVTIQNKVEPKEARRLQAQLRAGFERRPLVDQGAGAVAVSGRALGAGEAVHVPRLTVIPAKAGTQEHRSTKSLPVVFLGPGLRRDDDLNLSARLRRSCNRTPPARPRGARRAGACPSARRSGSPCPCRSPRPGRRPTR